MYAKKQIDQVPGLKKKLGVENSADELTARLREIAETMLSRDPDRRISPTALSEESDIPLAIIESFLRNNRDAADKILDEEEFERLFLGAAE